jgi:acid phosphatase
VKPGRYHDEINHFTILRTLQALYGLPPLARSADEQPITGIWTVD